MAIGKQAAGNLIKGLLSRNSRLSQHSRNNIKGDVSLGGTSVCLDRIASVDDGVVLDKDGITALMAAIVKMNACEPVPAPKGVNPAQTGYFESAVRAQILKNSPEIASGKRSVLRLRAGGRLFRRMGDLAAPAQSESEQECRDPMRFAAYPDAGRLSAAAPWEAVTT
jgi:hypothetical protein